MQDAIVCSRARARRNEIVSAPLRCLATAGPAHGLFHIHRAYLIPIPYSVLSPRIPRRSLPPDTPLRLIIAQFEAGEGWVS